MSRPAVCKLAETLGMGDGGGEASNAADLPPSSPQALGPVRCDPKDRSFFHALRALEVREVR